MGDLKTDVAVMGAGGAGMTAAISAAEGGAKVIVFEKRPFPGGNTNLAMSPFAIESKMQGQGNNSLTKDEAFKEFMEFTHWRANARLVRAFVDKSASTIDWLQQHGVEFAGEQGKLPSSSRIPGGRNSALLLKARGRGHGGASLIKALVSKAKEKGVDIHLATPPKKIVKDSGRITGMIVEDTSRKIIQVNAGAVIIATGGYAGNRGMIKKYSGFDLGDDLFVMVDLKLTGDGIRMAWEVGAAKEGMGMHLIYNVPGPGIVGAQPWVMETQVRLIQGQPYLWINQQGERFFDEGIAINTPFTGNAIARQKGRCAYLLFDENTRKKMEAEGFDYVSRVFPDKNLVDFDAQIKHLLDKGNKNVFVANSLEALGGKAGVNPGILQKTVNEYNLFCEKGHDDLFAKDPKFLRPVKQPKFYAFRIIPSAYGTLGGIKINERAEVLDKAQEVIPGLYAAGNDACIIYGDTPDYNFKLPGGALGFALNSGRIAGENAAKYIGK